MAVDKLSVSFDPELAREIRAAAEAEDLPVSAWLADAARRRLKLLVARRVIGEYETEFGAFTDDELAWARAQWPD